MQGRIAAVVNVNSDIPITFRINETGVLGGECADADSDEEFNPMLALDKYGAPFSF